MNTLGNNTHLVATYVFVLLFVPSLTLNWPYIAARPLHRNKTVKHDVTTLQTGAQGAGEAIKQIVIALINGEKADANLRDQVGGNLTAIRDALADLSSCVILSP